MGTTELQQRLQHEGVDVNLRTIQRDLKSLAERFPLESNGLSPQGWRWKKDGPDMSLPQMTSGQALTFMLVEQHLQSLVPASVLDELRPFFECARQQAQASNGPKHAWTNKVRIVPATQPLIPPAIDAKALAVIQEALLIGRRLDVLYDSRDKKRSPESGAESTCHRAARNGDVSHCYREKPFLRRGNRRNTSLCSASFSKGLDAR